MIMSKVIDLKLSMIDFLSVIFLNKPKQTV